MSEYITLAAAVLGLIATAVQLLPCKAMPWSWVARHLGRALNGEVMEKIDRNEAITARYRIVSFDDELRHSDTKHSEERFTQLLGDVDTYERYCKAHPDFENNKAVHAVAHIKEVYDTCCRENSFI